ncbi:MAG: hypothetical protein ACR2RV_05070, partial [Verrucomicrobiales bacterium]
GENLVNLLVGLSDGKRFTAVGGSGIRRSGFSDTRVGGAIGSGFSRRFAGLGIADLDRKCWMVGSRAPGKEGEDPILLFLAEIE